MSSSRDTAAKEDRAIAAEGGMEMGDDPAAAKAEREATAREHPVPSPPYRLAAFALVAWAVAVGLAAYDEYWSLPHAAAINAAVYVVAIVVVVSLTAALSRARAWRRAQTTMPTPVRDAVTGLPGHRHLLLRLEEEVSRAKRYRRPLSLAVVDVKSLQPLNDQYGRECGDQVLQHLAQVLTDSTRAFDAVARLADDDFAVILPECDERGARALIERIERHLTRSPAQVKVQGRAMHLWVGICAGVATLEDEPDSSIELLRRAEADLRTAQDERDKRRRLWLSA